MIAKYKNEPERINVYETHFSHINILQVIEYIKKFLMKNNIIIASLQHRLL